MLTAEEKDYFKDLLIKMLNELTKKGSNSVSNMYIQNEKYPDSTDWAIAQRERDINLRIREREKGLIGKIMEALNRIEKGSYGICEACEEEIGLERLKARPVTTLCIECKKRQEVPRGL